MTCNLVAFLLLSTWAVGWWPAGRIALCLISPADESPLTPPMDLHFSAAMRGLVFLVAWAGALVVVPAWLAIRFAVLPLLALVGHILDPGGRGERR